MTMTKQARRDEDAEIAAEMAEDAIMMAAWRREMAGAPILGDTFILAKMRRGYAVARAEVETLLRKSAAVSAEPVKKHVIAVCSCVMAG